jgi:hypothetical protein
VVHGVRTCKEAWLSAALHQALHYHTLNVRPLDFFPPASFEIAANESEWTNWAPQRLEKDAAEERPVNDNCCALDQPRLWKASVACFEHRLTLACAPVVSAPHVMSARG